MKTKLCILATAALLCGCNQERDAKIITLQKQVEVLAQQNQDIKARLDMTEKSEQTDTHLFGLLHSSQTNIENRILVLEIGVAETGVIDPATGLPSGRIDHIEQTVSNIVVYLNRGNARPVQNAYVPPGSVRGQMPASVAAQIKDAAIAKWPSDFEMQSYEIRQQTEAWFKVNQ